MALVAFCLDVLAVQGVISLLMVKLLLVQFDNACITPFMVRVATAALLGLLASMKPRLLAHVLPDGLVAIHAQAILRITVKLDVALLAILVPLGMTLDDLSWGQYRFNVVSVCRNHGSKKKQQQEAGPVADFHQFVVPSAHSTILFSMRGQQIRERLR
jgi:hypothetical protein